MSLFIYFFSGESGLGKSTLINSLFLTDLYPERYIPGAAGILPCTIHTQMNMHKYTHCNNGKMSAALPPAVPYLKRNVGNVMLSLVINLSMN